MSKNLEAFKSIREAVEARDRFLREHPELQPLQDEITRQIKNIGSASNRMAILDAMMRERVAELQKRLLEAKATLESLVEGGLAEEIAAPDDRSE